MMVSNYSYKDFRYYHILNLINSLGSVSRTKIAELTGYRNGTVGDLVKEMISESDVIETGKLSSESGRKPTLLSVNKSMCAIGIAMSYYSFTVVLQQMDGNILYSFSDKLAEEATNNEEAAIAANIELVVQAVRSIPKKLTEERFIGIGIALPDYISIISRPKNLEHSYYHSSDWITNELAERLRNEFGREVETYMPLGLVATAAYMFGKAKDCSNFACINLSNGIGSSIYCNGAVLKGSSFAAGQIGHTVVDYTAARNDTCACGKSGCMESSSAWPVIKKSIIEDIEKGYPSLIADLVKSKNGEIEPADLAEALNMGDRLCRYHVNKAAVYIGITVANLINTINPEKIVFYGSMLSLGDYFMSQVKQTMEEHVLSLNRKYEVEIAGPLSDAIVIGAAAQMFSSHLKLKEFSWVYSIDYERL